MTRKSGTGFGASLAKEVLAEAGEEGSQTLPKGDVLASRADSISKLGGSFAYETHEWVDPKSCRPSPQNARIYDELTYEDCRELIDSIIAEGRQRMPAIVRRTDDPQVPYEIVAGSRRHWAISWLRANSYPDFKYLIDVQQLDDESAFRISDLENRARTDITDLERSRSYAAALVDHYSGSIKRMSERLRIPELNLRRFIDLSSLDPIIIEALGGRRTALVSHARFIKAEMNKEERHDPVMTLAREIAAEQRDRTSRGIEPIPASEVLRRLTRTKPGGQGKVAPVDVTTDGGARLFTYVRPHKRVGLTLKMPARMTADREELKHALARLVDEIYG